MIFLFNMALLFTFVDSYTFDNREVIIDQATYYVNNLSASHEKDLNFWALNELYSDNCALSSVLQGVISGLKSKELESIFVQFPCGLKAEENLKQKINRLKKYTTSNNSFALAVYTISLIKEIEERRSFEQDYLSRWLDTTTKEQQKLLSQITYRHKNLSLSFSKENLMVTTLLITSASYRNLFDVENLRETTNKARTIISASNSDLFNSMLSYLGFMVNYGFDNYNEATKFYHDFVSYKYFPASKIKLRALSGIDFSLYAQGRFDESLALQRNYSIPLAEFLGEKEQLDDILLRQSSNLYKIGKYKEARSILEQLGADQYFTGNRKLLLTNLSLCYLKLGEYRSYISILLQALPDKVEADISEIDYNIMLGTYRNLALLYTTLGDTTSALDYFESATKLAKQRQDSTAYAGIHADLGTYYWYLHHDAEKSLHEFDIAENIYAKSSDLFNLDRILLRKSNILTEKNELIEAEQLLDKIKENATLNAETPLYVTALIGELDVALRDKDLIKAKLLIKQIEINPLGNLEFEILTKYHSLKALYLNMQGNTRLAYNYLEPVIEQVIERIKATTNAETGQWLARHDYLNAFEIMIDLLQELDDEKKALQFLDSFKSINSAAIYNNPLLRTVKLSERELIEDNNLTNQIIELRSRYLSSTGKEQLSIKAKIDQLSAKKLHFSSMITPNSEEDEVPLWRVQNQLSYNEMVLHFTELNNKLYVSTITKNDVNIRTLILTGEIRILFEEAANSLAGGTTSLNRLYQIYTTLNLVSIPPFINTVSVIPDNYLYRIPLEVLPIDLPNSDNSYGSTKYLIENYTFEYFNSLSDFIFNNRLVLNNTGHNFSAFSITNFNNSDNGFNLPSLPHATEEVQHISASLTSFPEKKKTIYTENEATKSNFLREISKSAIVHIATHSEISERDPLFSTIFFNSDSTAASDKNEDIIYAYELFSTKLNSNFIMLNSCSSGSGGYMQGSGILGITRALKYAGAKSLALNLWSVSDHVASEIATDFYTYLNKGLSKSEAMRLAKLKQLQNGNANPHYWGAYSVIGNPSPIVRKPAVAIVVYPALILISLIFGFLVRSKI